ncbi:MAG: CHY zinc finger protein [Corynebacterium sp.]|nr:CHY zinc finger protein [Corynebacterium sp.]
MDTSVTIIGNIDGQGRCQHWHSHLDVVANKCATCQQWFACSLCHPADHPFGPMPRTAIAVLCGVCRHAMTFMDYNNACPACSHPFNPGCKLHTDIYFHRA